MLGPHLVNSLGTYGKVVALGRSSGTVTCDLTDRQQTSEVISALAPSLTIHAAALTNVDFCEEFPDDADRQNRAATANVAAALPKGSRLLFISTDQVYPDEAGPHKEGTEAPVNQYGKSKLDGETEALKHGNAIAVRTNLFGPSLTGGRQSLSDFFIRNLSSHTPTMLFRDVLFSPLHFHTLSACLWKLAISDYVGAVNLGSRDGITKAEFGLAVAAHKNLPLKNVTIGNSTELPGRARRPLDLRMDITRAEDILDMELPSALQEIGKL